MWLAVLELTSLRKEARCIVPRLLHLPKLLSIFSQNRVRVADGASSSSCRQKQPCLSVRLSGRSETCISCQQPASGSSWGLPST